MMSEGIVKINSKLLEPSELKKIDKQEKERISSTGTVLKDIRLQLNDQLKCLDGRLDTQQSIVSEFQDVFRRRAEIEANYSKDLDKLAKVISNRHKEQKQKRDAWSTFSSIQLWEQLLAQTRKSSRDHSALSDIYLSHIVQRCNRINEDLQRIYKKCRDIGFEIHEEVLKVLHELHTAMKTHHTYQSEFRQAESKLQLVEKQRAKLVASVPSEKRQKHKKFRLVEKELSKRRQKFDEARLNATKARNEYLLCMDAANSSVQKYFVDDLSDLIDCMDFGFHHCLHRAVMMHVNGLDQLRRSLQRDTDSLTKVLSTLDSRLDKQRFLEYNNAVFMIPKKFEHTPARRDETESLVQKSVLDELETRKAKLKDRLAALKAESEEIWKSMETAERTLTEMVGCADWDTTRFFVEDDKSSHQRESEAVALKQKSEKQEVEDFYIGKFREYVLNSNRVARLQAKYDHIRVTLLGDKTSQIADGGIGVLTMTRRPNVGRRRRIGRTPRRQQGGTPKLFGGSLEEYLEEEDVEIPPILKSCVRVINLYGLHHHGIFRVSGSQVEIAHFRDAFERGEDPLADVTDASDINSVAGVLKLYLRELREPVFPIQYFDHFMELALLTAEGLPPPPPPPIESVSTRNDSKTLKKLESKHEFVVKVRDLVRTWPRPIFIVMRYLFAFLNHLSEFSDENMMDPYNLAICFGPTLVPIPEDRDQVQFQNLVNELIKNFIIFHEDIFPASVAGTAYEKYMSVEPEEMGESPPEQSQDELDDYVTEEDDSIFREDGDEDDGDRDDLRDLSLDLFGKSEVLEAQALYDFNARSPREVHFRKGDNIILHKQVSSDWWRGAVNGRDGLIPDKYIMLKIRGEDERERLESCRSRDGFTRERSASSTGVCGVHSPRRSLSNSDTPPPEGSLSGFLSLREDSPTTSRKVGSGDDVDSGEDKLRRNSVPAGSRSSRASRSRSSMTTPAATTRTPPPDENFKISSNLKEDVAAVVGNTHIIRVSGPVTNLDDKSLVEEEPAVFLSSSPDATEECMNPRSRLPVCASMEARLRETSSSSSVSTMPTTNHSRDSLASTGSNQELQSALDSTIAQVEAITQQVEESRRRDGLRATTELRKSSLSSAPGINRITPRTTTNVTGCSSSSSSNNVLLRQSSWSSREQLCSSSSNGSINSRQCSSLSRRQNVAGNKLLSSSPSTPRKNSEDDAAGKSGGFSRNRDVWERRSSLQQNRGSATTSSQLPSSNQQIRGGFRSNRDFWEQRGATQQKQTPDLVMDLPVTSSSGSTVDAREICSSTGVLDNFFKSLEVARREKKETGSLVSSTSPSVASVAPLPRPRTSKRLSDDGGKRAESYPDKDHDAEEGKVLHKTSTESAPRSSVLLSAGSVASAVTDKANKGTVQEQEGTSGSEVKKTDVPISE